MLTVNDGLRKRYPIPIQNDTEMGDYSNFLKNAILV